MIVAICLVTCFLVLINLIFQFVIANFVVRMGEVINEARNEAAYAREMLEQVLAKEVQGSPKPDSGLVDLQENLLPYGDPRV
jgi:hypothetical protein